ncbi:hypothetical protein DMENIID0001_140450 [Sergentomyia squamirostris]
MCPGSVEFESGKRRLFDDDDDSEFIAIERSESENVLSSFSVSVINVVDLFASVRPPTPPGLFAIRAEVRECFVHNGFDLGFCDNSPRPEFGAIAPPSPILLRHPIPIRERPLDVRTLEQQHKRFMKHVMDVFDWLGEIGSLSSLWEEQPEEPEEYFSVPWYHQKFNERGEPHFIDRGWRSLQNNRG